MATPSNAGYYYTVIAENNATILFNNNILIRSCEWVVAEKWKVEHRLKGLY